MKAGKVGNPAVCRPCALRGLIYNQAPVAGRYAHKVSPTGKALRPCNPTGWHPVADIAHRTNKLIDTNPLFGKAAVADDLAEFEVDHVLADVGGAVADPFEVARDEDH